jgi:hypothetical protein
MGIALSKLIDSIGIGVQKVCKVMDERAAELFLHGYADVKGIPMFSGEGMGRGTDLFPINYSLYLSDGDKKELVIVPVVSLLHNNSMQLESVEMTLRFVIEDRKDEEIYVSVKPEPDTEKIEPLSELKLKFKTTPPTEGETRMIEKQLKETDREIPAM